MTPTPFAHVISRQRLYAGEISQATQSATERMLCDVPLASLEQVERVASVRSVATISEHEALLAELAVRTSMQTVVRKAVA
jgi:hypothetical protein